MQTYSVKVIKHTFPNPYHVINDKTKITHSSYRTLEQALQHMRDLNKAEKRKFFKVVA